MGLRRISGHILAQLMIHNSGGSDMRVVALIIKIKINVIPRRSAR